MKYILVTTLLTVFFNAFAQVNESSKRIDGVFGHLFIGPALIQSKQMDDYFKQDVLGASYASASVGYTIGGEWLAMFNNFLIGGGGFAIIKPVSVARMGSVNTSLSGGYIKLAYRFYSDRNKLMYLYSSLGVSTYTLEISNLSDSLILMFDRRSPITPGKKETYSIAGFLFDCGIGFKTFVFNEADEEEPLVPGVLTGMDLGCVITLPANYWHHGKADVSGPPGLPVMFCPYIRITFGGGGFGTGH